MRAHIPAICAQIVPTAGLGLRSAAAGRSPANETARMSWQIDEHVLEQLRNLWRLAPPGTPVRKLTQPLAAALVDATGPEQATAQASAVLGDVDAAYLATLALKILAGEVDVLLHAVGIAAALPHVLGDGERVLSVSVDHDGGGTAGSAGLGVGDLVTDRQVAEFTFIRWAVVGGNSQREVKLLRDLIKLDLLDDEQADGRRRILYVTGGAPALRFLTSNQTIASKLRNSAGILTRFEAHHGGTFVGIGAYWAHLQAAGRVELVDLHEIAPSLRPPTAERAP